MTEDRHNIDEHELSGQHNSNAVPTLIPGGRLKGAKENTPSGLYAASKHIIPSQPNLVEQEQQRVERHLELGRHPDERGADVLQLSVPFELCADITGQQGGTSTA